MRLVGLCQYLHMPASGGGENIRVKLKGGGEVQLE